MLVAIAFYLYMAITNVVHYSGWYSNTATVMDNSRFTLDSSFNIKPCVILGKGLIYCSISYWVISSSAEYELIISSIINNTIIIGLFACDTCKCLDKISLFIENVLTCDNLVTSSCDGPFYHASHQKFSQQNEAKKRLFLLLFF